MLTRDRLSGKEDEMVRDETDMDHRLDIALAQ